jgi:hypothetical protein
LLNISHTLLGNSDICNGLNVLFGVDVRQGIHDLPLNEIVDRTQKDPDLQAFITAVKTNRWEKSYENSVLNTFTIVKYSL